MLSKPSNCYKQMNYTRGHARPTSVTGRSCPKESQTRKRGGRPTDGQKVLQQGAKPKQTFVPALWAPPSSARLSSAGKVASWLTVSRSDFLPKSLSLALPHDCGEETENFGHLRPVLCFWATRKPLLVGRLSPPCFSQDQTVFMFLSQSSTSKICLLDLILA